MMYVLQAWVQVGKMYNCLLKLVHYSITQSNAKTEKQSQCTKTTNKPVHTD